MEAEDKGKLKILAKRARLERFGNLSEFSRISKILIERENKVKYVEQQLLDLDKQVCELEEKNTISALFSGSGEKVRQLSESSMILKERKKDLQAARAELESNLLRAIKRHEIVREIYANSQSRLSKLEDKNELNRINEEEHRAYIDEMGLLDTSRVSRSKGPSLIKS